MLPIRDTLAQELDALRQAIPALRTQHPDDFWTVFQQRADHIADQATQDEAPLVAKQLDAMLIEHNLGPADPGA